MKRLYEIKEMKPVDISTYVFVKHGNSDKKFLFEVPDGLDIECGETVLCDTMYGEKRGKTVTDTFELERGAAHILSDILGFYFPVKQIIGVLVLPDKDDSLSETYQLPF